MNPKRPTPRHTIIKMIKVKDRILKAARVKQRITYKETPIRLSADFFFVETLQGRKKCHDTFKVLKGKKKTYNLRYSIQQGYHSEFKER